MSQNLAQYIVLEDSFVQTHNGFHQFFLKAPKFLVELGSLIFHDDDPWLQ